VELTLRRYDFRWLVGMMYLNPYTSPRLLLFSAALVQILTKSSQLNYLLLQATIKSLSNLALLVAGLAIGPALAAKYRDSGIHPSIPDPSFNDISRRHGSQTSPDATCGSDKGYTCLNSKWGSCCSKYGYWYVFAVCTEILILMTNH
jgi:hypothetical protein